LNIGQEEMMVVHQALRPYATAGVALLGASLIAVTPVTAPSPGVPQVQVRAVQLLDADAAAAGDPFSGVETLLSTLTSDLNADFTTLDSGLTTLDSDVTSGFSALDSDFATLFGNGSDSLNANFGTIETLLREVVFDLEAIAAATGADLNA
jgi:hypothetical protein